MLDKLERRLEQGLKLVQLREPGLGEQERAIFCENAIGRAHRYGCKVMVKAPHPGADGMHFTAAQLMALNDRPKDMLAAASCHDREQLERAMQLELDFAVLGPVQEKPDRPALGWARFAAACARHHDPGLRHRRLEERRSGRGVERGRSRHRHDQGGLGPTLR